MQGHNEHLLINYLDRTLEEKEMREVEALINADGETRKHWQYLQLAVEAVEYAALYDQVAAIKENFRTIQPAEVLLASRKSVRVRMRTMVSIAATLLLVIVGVVSYKYFTVNATRVYQQAFIVYTLPTTRGQATITDLEKAYQLQNWNGVIATANQTSLTNNKALFLAGMAHMQLKQYAQSIVLFQQVLANNTQTGDDYFQDEAQFYLAMSNLASNKTLMAIILLEQIRNDDNHVYHKQAGLIRNLDWQILKIKAKSK